MKKHVSRLTLKRETIAHLDLFWMGKVAGGVTAGCFSISCIPCGTGTCTVDTTFSGGTGSQGQSCAASGCTQQN